VNQILIIEDMTGVYSKQIQIYCGKIIDIFIKPRVGELKKIKKNKKGTALGKLRRTVLNLIRINRRNK